VKNYVAENSPNNGKRFLFCTNMTGTEKRKLLVTI
jgi:hypothetical protein